MRIIPPELNGLSGNLPNLEAGLLEIIKKKNTNDTDKTDALTRLFEATIKPERFYDNGHSNHLLQILKRIASKSSSAEEEKIFINGVLEFLGNLFSGNKLKLLKKLLPKLRVFFSTVEPATQINQSPWATLAETEAYYHDAKGNFRGYLVDLITENRFNATNLKLLRSLSCRFSQTCEGSEETKFVPLLFYILEKGTDKQLEVYLNNLNQNFATLDSPYHGPSDLWASEPVDKKSALAFTIEAKNIPKKLQKIKLLVRHGANVNNSSSMPPANAVLLAVIENRLDQKIGLEILQALNKEDKLDVCVKYKNKSAVDLVNANRADVGEDIFSFICNKDPADPVRIFFQW